MFVDRTVWRKFTVSCRGVEQMEEEETEDHRQRSNRLRMESRFNLPGLKEFGSRVDGLCRTVGSVGMCANTPGTTTS